MGKTKGGCWTYSWGEYPHTVRVFERTPCGIIYGATWDPSLREGRGNERRVSLGHRDREAAEQWAKDQANALAEGSGTPSAAFVPTVAKVFALYLEKATPHKSPKIQKDDARQVRRWTEHLGPSFNLTKLSNIEWDDFVLACEREGLGPRSIERVMRFLRAVCFWAMGARVHGHRVLKANPTDEFTNRIPKERNPNQPIADEARTEAVRRVCGDVRMRRTRGGRQEIVESYLPEVFEIVVESGRRISPVCQLQVDDLHREEHARAPFGEIQFPGETDKEGRDWRWPMTPEARAAIDRALVKRLMAGPGWLFPAPANATKPLRTETATDWLHKAEGLAGVEPFQRGAFHPYRRKWATDRKHLPGADVALAGGWGNEATVREVYTKADPETTLAAVFYKPARCDRCGGALSPDPALRFCPACGTEIDRNESRRRA